MMNAALKFALQVMLGAAYVTLQFVLLKVFVIPFGVIADGLGRVLVVLVSTAFTVFAIFLLNHLLTKTPVLRLGLVMAAVTFVWVYCIKTPLDPIATIFSVLNHWPSALNMLILIGAPVATGITLRLMPNNSFKPNPLRGSA